MSKAPLGQMIIELGLDSTDFGKGLTSARREVRTWSNEMSASMRAADFAGDKVGKLQARHEGLTKIITAQQKQVDSLKQSYDNSFVDGKPTAQTEKLASQLKRAEANLITYQSELRTTAGELAKMRVQTEGFTGWLNNTGKGLQKFGKGATTVGNTLTKYFTVPLTAGVTLATKAAMDWETAFAGVVKTSDELVDVNGNVVYSYQDLEDGLRDLAKQLPATHTEIAGVGEAAGQLGIHTDNITSFTKTMIDLGESTNMSAETAATSFARFANITNMSQKDFDRLGSSVVDLGNNLATTEAEITALAMRLAGAGSQIGLSEADILGLAGALSSVGIEAEMGGSALSKTMINMAVASETGLNAVADLENATGMTRRELELMSSNASKDFKAVADSLGMTSTEVNKIIKAGSDLEGFAAVAGMTSEQFVKAFQEDAVGALGAFIEGLGAAEEKGTTAIALLDELGISEVRLRDALLRAGNASELFADSVKMSNDAWEENTALTIEAQQRYDTLESQLGMLRNEAADVAITFGGPFVSAFKEALETARPFIGSMADLAQSFADADPKTQQMILKMIGFGIAVGPVTRTVGSFSTTIGNASVKTVEFLSELAKKKAMADFGTAAATASGTKGIGAMTGALSTLNPWLVGLVGVGGLLTVGYGAWKLWGEEVYEAGERTQRWGTDVGESTDSVLTDIESVTGKFGLMKQGISTDSESMIGDFKKIGNAINDDLNSRLEITEEYLAGLPETLRKSQQEILQTYQDNLNEALEITENNSAEIEAIHQRASDENRELTRDELEYIRSLQNQSLASYLSTLELSAEEEKAIRQALTGDIADTTREQGKQMLALLSQQEKGMADARKLATDETHRYMKENNISPDSKLGRELLADVNRYHDALVVSNQRTMKELIDMYPELEKEVDLSTGRMINRQNMTQREYDEIITMNRILLDGWADSHRDVAKAAEDANSYIVDVTSEGAKAWNDVVLESGGNMDTFREKLIESTKETTAWNDIRLQLKNADLDSNAKLVIGEAAIMNGWWDGMAWEDKQAVLKDNFSDVVYRAIQDEGSWAKLTWQEQTALLNNEFSDEVIQAIMDEKKWRQLPWEAKEAILTSNSPETMIQVLKDIGLWDRLNPNILKLLIDETPATKKIDSTTRKLDEYGDILETATLNARDETKSGVDSAWNRINSLPTTRTTTLTTRRVTTYESYDTRSGYQRLYKHGTNYHPGGLAMVNDQKGPMFRELIQHPDGTSYIPHGRNVVLPLPRGAKVLKASLTKQRFPDLPQYRDGIGNIPVESTVIQNINRGREAVGVTNQTIINDYSALEKIMRELLNKVDNLKETPDDRPIILNLDGKNVGRIVGPYIDIDNGDSIKINERGLAN